MNEDPESDVQSIEENFTEDSLQFYQAEVSFKIHKELHSQNNINYTLTHHLLYVITSGWMILIG